MLKVHYPHLGSLVKSAGEEYQVVKRGRDYHGCGEEYNAEKSGKVKHYHRLYDIGAVVKNIKWDKGEGNGNFVEENQD